MGRRSESKRANEMFGEQAPQMKLDIGELENDTCGKCGGIFFQQVIVMKKVSALISPSGQEGVIPVPGPFACIRCGYVFGASDPEDVPEEGLDMEETVGEPSGLITTDLSMDV